MAKQKIPITYLKQYEAARYVRYSVQAFRDYASLYEIPKYGPGRKRYLISDLEAWMRNPTVFKALKTTRQRDQRAFTPVAM